MTLMTMPTTTMPTMTLMLREIQKTRGEKAMRGNSTDLLMVFFCSDVIYVWLLWKFLICM